MSARGSVVFALAAAAAAAPGPYDPTDRYELRMIEGWKVRVHRGLLEEKKELGARVLEHLRVKLYEVNRALPRAARQKLLAGVTFWMEAGNPKVPGGCYHPSRTWLEEHGFNPDKEKGIEFGNPGNFLGWSRVQPSMVLHELAHAYHHQVLGHDHAGIKEAFRRAVESRSYESVLYYDGTRKRAYALNGDQEYFAELSEAWFGTNDFYPFVRPEVREHDPGMAKLLPEVWGKED